MVYNNEDISLKSVDMSSYRTPESGIQAEDLSRRTEYHEENAEDDDFQARMWRNIDESTAYFTTFVKEKENKIKYGIYAILLLGYIGYLAYACYRDLEDATVMLSLTGVILFHLIYAFIRDHFGETIWKNCGSKTTNTLNKVLEYGLWPTSLATVAGLGVALYFLCREKPEQLISGAGLIFFVLFTYIFSKYPRQVKWRPVVWGLVLQFLLALFILRTNVGFVMFKWLGNVVQTFVDFSDEGAKFVYGDPQYLEHFFAFKIMALIIFFSSSVSVLYYWGAMKFVIKKIAWLMERTMKTSVAESLNAAASIFLGPTNVPLMIRPILKDLTKSEIHAVMTGGFATIGAGVMGAYIAFGVSASHLLSASVMSAPAALAISKLFYPETERCVRTEEIDLPKGEQRNVIEAASHGAATAIPMTLNIAVNLIAFIAILALLNGILGYLGGLVGVDELSFQFICSYVFSPIAFLMGVEWKDCFLVAELIGLKTFLNEFVAYERLAELINNRKTGTGLTISLRSEVIATYALCGFSNVGTIGSMLGGLTPLVPSRASDFAEVAVRALIAGSIACFMTACVAGLLYDASDYEEKLHNVTRTVFQLQWKFR